MPMVRGRGARLRKGRAPHAMRFEIAAPVVHIRAGELAELRKRGSGTARARDRRPGPGRYVVMTRPFQPLSRMARWCSSAIRGPFGGGEHFDAEAIEQRARTELRCRQRFADGVVVEIRRALAPAPLRIPKIFENT